GVFERFAPGAFDAHLKTDPDVVALFNHDMNHVLGRTPHTLTLKTDSRGLNYTIDLSGEMTQTMRDLKISIARGDIKGSSFAFMPTDVEWSQEGGNDIRLIRSAQIFDVSPVTRAAYSGSSTGLRSEDE